MAIFVFPKMNTTLKFMATFEKKGGFNILIFCLQKINSTLISNLPLVKGNYFLLSREIQQAVTCS